MVRLQKFLSEAGIASRRAAEKIILGGGVTVNGEPVRQLGTKVDPVRDVISVGGVPVKGRRKLYIALNKPAGYLCSRRDPMHRRAVNDLLPREWSHLYPVGRLDYETEGLLFLTNDGEFCLRLTHPRYGVRKKYLVTVEGGIGPGQLTALTRGVVHDGEELKAERVRVVDAGPTRSVVEVELAEGKNREVRRLFESLRLRVMGLRRTQIGRIKLGDLPKGRWRTLTGPEIKSLLLNSTGPVRVGTQGH